MITINEALHMVRQTESYIKDGKTWLWIEKRFNATKPTIKKYYDLYLEGGEEAVINYLKNHKANAYSKRASNKNAESAHRPSIPAHLEADYKHSDLWSIALYGK